MKMKFLTVFMVMVIFGCSSNSENGVSSDGLADKPIANQREDYEKSDVYNEESSSNSEDLSSSSTDFSSSSFADQSANSEYVIPSKISGSLNEYTKQFTSDAQELFFDSSVLAYYGYGYSPTSVSDSYLMDGFYKLDKDSLNTVFPGIRERIAEKHEGKDCGYYLMVVGDGGQPTGYVVQSVQKDSVTLVPVVRSGEMCKYSSAYKYLGMLIENCSGDDLSKASVSVKKYVSETWNCNDEKSSANAYGYWIREDLM
ncbi:MAG: hypothetical protein MJZ05_06210 [Fibrobacter sp.]|nr:hypothetical protein [Fibrobacter sp.]